MNDITEYEKKTQRLICKTGLKLGDLKTLADNLDEIGAPQAGRKLTVRHRPESLGFFYGIEVELV